MAGRIHKMIPVITYEKIMFNFVAITVTVDGSALFGDRTSANTLVIIKFEIEAQTW